MTQLQAYFDRVVIVNLRRRPDRLAATIAELDNCSWPFAAPIVFEAIDGSVVPAPEDWKSGPGAWGCLRSHQLILEKAIMDRVQNLLVLEDDICFVEDFSTKVAAFLNGVPSDWDQLMLGGQHIKSSGKPILVRPGILRCVDCERTHCYAIRPRFMEKLYSRWIGGGMFNGRVHCDWIMGRDPDLQMAHNVFAPERFLVGQRRSASDVSGFFNPPLFWNSPHQDSTVILLDVPKHVAIGLRKHGFHLGLNPDPVTGIDTSFQEILKVFSAPAARKREGIAHWIEKLQWEVASDETLICAIWHPELSDEEVLDACKWPVVKVSGTSVRDVLNHIPKELLPVKTNSIALDYLVYLQAPKQVMDELRGFGWHNGYWRDPETGVDKGLLQLKKSNIGSERRKMELTILVQLLQRESQVTENGVAVIWGVGIDLPLLEESAFDCKVLSISATDSADATSQLQKLLDENRRFPADR